MSIVRWKRKPIANEAHDIVRAVAVEAPKDVMVEVEAVAGFSPIFSTIFAAYHFTLSFLGIENVIEHVTMMVEVDIHNHTRNH